MFVRSDDRAVSELLGAILVFGLLLLLLVVAQFALVPTLNQQAEIEHEARAIDDVNALQESLFRVAATGAPEQTLVEAGMTHPKYPFLVNPPAVRGTIETVAGGQLILSNVTSSNNETADYWERGPAGTYNTTRAIEYRADYYEYGAAGTRVLEGPVLYTDFDGTNVVTGDQIPLISGRRVTLVTISGDLSDGSTGSVPVALSVISGPSRPMSVTNVNGSAGDPIVIEFVSGLSETAWQDILADEIDATGTDPDRYVADVSKTGDLVRVTLEAGETYDLRMAGVGIGENFPREKGAYLTRDTTSFAAIPVGGGEVFVEVRDRYNNPVSGVNVSWGFVRSAPNATLTDSYSITDENGRAVVGINTNQSDVLELRAFATTPFDNDTDGKDFDGPGGLSPAIDAHEIVEFEVKVGDGDPDSPGGPGNGNNSGEPNPNIREGNLVYRYALTDTQGSPATNNWVEALWNNTKIGEGNITITDIRVNQVVFNGPGASVNKDGEPANVTIDFANVTSLQAEVGGRFVSLPTKVTVDDKKSIWIRFEFENADGDPLQVNPNDWFVVTMIFADDSRAVYFVRPDLV